MDELMNLHNKSNSELVKLQSEIESDPANKNTDGGLFLYSKKARAKLDKIARQITENLREAREKAGNPVPCDGYSGLQTNKRK
jgi:hypothetical protein